MHRTGKDDIPTVDEKYSVGIFDRVESVGDNHLGGGFWEFRKDGFEELLGDGIDIGSGFIQDEEFRIPQKGSDKGNELFLSEADRLSTRDDLGFESLSEELEQARKAILFEQGEEFCLWHLLVRSISVEDIFPEGSGKKKWFLEDESDFFTPFHIRE